MALNCARSVYEGVDRRMPEAAALANWLRQSATAFGLPDTAVQDNDALYQLRSCGVPAQAWRKIGSALTSAEAALPDNADTPADRWIRAIAETLRSIRWKRACSRSGYTISWTSGSTGCSTQRASAAAVSAGFIATPG
jgi:hypothetical protein